MTDESCETVIKFVADDDAYLRWIAEHPHGFVVNCARKPKSDYLKLHSTQCPFLQSDKWSNWTTSDFIKVCSLDIQALRNWAAENTGGQLDACNVCDPSPNEDAASHVLGTKTIPPTIDC